MNRNFITFTAYGGALAIVNIDQIVNVNYYKNGNIDNFGDTSFLDIILSTQASYKIKDKEVALKILDCLQYYLDEMIDS